MRQSRVATYFPGMPPAVDRRIISVLLSGMLSYWVRHVPAANPTWPWTASQNIPLRKPLELSQKNPDIHPFYGGLLTMGNPQVTVGVIMGFNDWCGGTMGYPYDLGNLHRVLGLHNSTWPSRCDGSIWRSKLQALLRLRLGAFRERWLGNGHFSSKDRGDWTDLTKENGEISWFISYQWIGFKMFKGNQWETLAFCPSRGVLQNGLNQAWHISGSHDSISLTWTCSEWQKRLGIFHSSSLRRIKVNSKHRPRSGNAKTNV